MSVGRPAGLAGWARRRSLRARLTAAAVAVVAAALSLSAALLVIRVESALVAGVDAAARDRAERVATAIGSGRSAASVLTADVVVDDEVVQVLDGDRAVLASSVGRPGGRPLLTAPAGTGPEAVTQDGLALSGEQDEPYRVLSLPVRAPDGQRVLVQVGLPLDDAEDSVEELTSALTVGVPAVVAVLAVLTWLLAGRALRPVEALRREAADIPGDALDRRLAVPAGGDELARLATTFNALLGRAEDATRRQREFVADAAHEIRSPLASLRTQLEVAALHDDPSWREQLPALTEDAQRLSRLVDDLLRLARIDARVPLARDEVDLDDLVLETAERIRRHTTRHVDTSAVSAARVTGDRDALARVVQNLLDNALRHARTTVSVSLIATHQALLTVRDDGPGIPVDQRERVFDRFTRLDDARSRDVGGTGLGLAIVRDVVRQHGGDVVVEDAAPGARLVVRLPLTG
ncbi:MULTISPECIES: sensor histidine kinase [unclassified Modestobacter]|uniref:sensor histidine kinase n=1 Tax=unclassified Modestobacter TaxID=2643866 RepID=UPI0022AA11ED|nr:MULTISPECIES: HAMP domain-containing sensor histidine kinase [unclassified Modestobacter]MCZ2827194.1 HAMP domain-containing sensor histidine kinase [Modestobacter sp. VKM Ac-2981]MCZ2854898.1 HAMP domain-containing sensor histidine kinase [Modestobacter sp. VKM Ac-2982]